MPVKVIFYQLRVIKLQKVNELLKNTQFEKYFDRHYLTIKTNRLTPEICSLKIYE
jgi:hypothetical protein